ncbi:dihydropteroate synthase [Terricaulis silvestris]|uniref:Dihydropteroate synthase n=1 Tax=Terricaulis silvestris TaxID=2686094 RepID=A0A6I6MHG8_9CAUL|nr:dihydropteroate synthase [Terricaulis silvestris]QGZ94310.1 Dihydropteroate synthase [Terricaulis silvestris]
MNKVSLPPPKIAGGPYVMGILNVTPDSFSDGGAEGAAAPRGLAMIEAGADIIDVGGESTRPGAEPVDEREEIARVTPVIAALRASTKAPISIDTMKPAVAMAAVSAGATMWNDVNALRAPGAMDTAASMHRPVVLMHMLGEPGTMQADPHYDDVVTEVIAYLRTRVIEADAKGVDDIWVDPGIGFGKTVAHNLALLNAVDRIGRETGKPVVIGASRKRFIASIDERARDAGRDRLGGSVAAALIAAQRGAAMVRVHDVAETVQALKLWRATQG